MQSYTGCVLVVDDYPGAAEGMALLFDCFGAVTRTATTGQEALAVLAQCEVDLVMLDLDLPDMNGLDIARVLRARGDRCPYMVAITGSGDPTLPARAMAAGVDRFILKPLQASDLRDVIASVKALASAAPA